MPLPYLVRSHGHGLALRGLLRIGGRRFAAGAFAAAVLGLGGCAQSPQQLAEPHHPKEYFPSSVYGPASRRVIADGQPVPHGGGQYLVGKPYTIAGQTYYPSERKITQVGLASWYGDAFHGRLTANGEVYDRDGFTAAHPTMPLPSYARVTNLRNNYSMIVRVNDRGPYHANRVMDVSRRVAESLDFQRGGTAKVKVEYVGNASLAGSDDAKLYATLRTNGPARLDGVEGPRMVAEATPRASRVASLEPYAPAPALPSKRVVEDHRAEALEAFREHQSSAIRPSRAVGKAPDHIRAAAREPAVQPRSFHAAATPLTTEFVAKRDTRQTAGRLDERVVRVASRGDATMHALSFGGKTVGPRLGGTTADAKHGQSRSSAHEAPIAARIVVLPPARPAKVASAASPGSIRHASTGLRLTRSRDD